MKVDRGDSLGTRISLVGVVGKSQGCVNLPREQLRRGLEWEGCKDF